MNLLMNSVIRLFIFIALLLLVTTHIYAEQFRNFVPIGRPAKAPEGVTVIENPAPVERGKVETAVKGLLENWNSADTESLLADDFYDSDRLSDVMAEKVPRDARLRLLSVRGSQTLQQYERKQDGITVLSSVVSVTATTQMEFNDPVRGFRRLNGENEYILRIEEEVLEGNL